MSAYYNRLYLRGLELILDKSAGIIHPQLVDMWTGEEDQEKVRRDMASPGRDIWETAEVLSGYLKEYLHTETSEEMLAWRGAGRPSASWSSWEIRNEKGKSTGTSSRSSGDGRSWTKGIRN